MVEQWFSKFWSRDWFLFSDLSGRLHIKEKDIYQKYSMKIASNIFIEQWNVKQALKSRFTLKVTCIYYAWFSIVTDTLVNKSSFFLNMLHREGSGTLMLMLHFRETQTLSHVSDDGKARQTCSSQKKHSLLSQDVTLSLGTVQKRCRVSFPQSRRKRKYFLINKPLQTPNEKRFHLS